MTDDKKTWDKPAAWQSGGRGRFVPSAVGPGGYYVAPGQMLDYADEIPDGVGILKVEPWERDALSLAIEENGGVARPYMEPWWLRPVPQVGEGMIPATSPGVGATPWSSGAAGQGVAVRFSLFFPRPRIAVDIWTRWPGNAEVARRGNRCREAGVAYVPVVRGPGGMTLMAQRMRDSIKDRDEKLAEAVPTEEPAPPREPDGIGDSGVSEVREHGEAAAGGTGLAAVVRPKPED